MIRIYRKKTPKGSQMFAEFDFRVVKGVFRFERERDDIQTKAANPPDPQKNKQKSKRNEFEEKYRRPGELDSEGEHEYDQYANKKQSPTTPKAFYLRSITQPSAKHQCWSYRWRGQDIGESVIELYSDKNLYPIKFFGPKAQKLEGTFECDFMKDCRS